MKQRHRYPWGFLRNLAQQWMSLVLGIILMLAVVGVRQELLREEQQSGVQSFLPDVIFFGGVVGAWALAFSVYLGQRSERYVRQARKIHQRLQQEILERQRIETELRSSEASIRNLTARLKLAVESARIGIWDWDIINDLLIWDDQMCRLYGVDLADFSGVYEVWTSALHPDDFELATTAIQQAIRGEKDYSPEFRVIHPDGSIRYIQAYAVVQRNAVGQAQRMIGVNFDVTERKQAEIALQESKIRYQQLVSHMNAGFVVHAPDTHILECNTAACELLGLSMEQMQGREAIDPAWHFVREDGTSMPAEEFPVNLVLSTQLPLERYVLGINREDQARVWVLVTAFPEFDNNEQLKQVVVTFIDISQLKQAEIALQTSQARFAGILEIANDAIISINAAQQIILFNQGAEKIFGYTAEEALGQPLSMLMPNRFAQAHQQHINQYSESGNKTRPMAKRSGIFGRRKDGTEFPAEASISQLNLSGEITFTTFLRDITKRQQAEAAMARLAAIVESSEDAIISKSLDGTITSWNAGAERIFGYSAEEIVGQSGALLIPEDNLNEEQRVLEQIYRGERITSYDTQRQRKDGTLIDISMTVSPLRNFDGSIVGVSKIARDISDRKRIEIERQRMENALRKSEFRFQTFMNHSPAPAWITDANGVILYVSETYLRTFQLPISDLIGKSIFELYPTPVAQQFLNNIQAVAKTRQTLETIEIAPRRDGTSGDFLVYKFPVPEDSEQDLVGGIAIDVTLQYQTESALQRSEEQLKLALEASGDGLWDWNIATGEVYYSPQYMTMLGYEVGELSQDFETWKYLTHPDDQPWVLDRLNAHIKESSRQYSFDYRVRTKSGEWKWIADYGKVVARDPQGNPLRMIGTHRDVSDRKQAELALRQAMEAAEAANLAKSIFLANMSHELRTPLNVILGFAQIMSHDPSLTPAQLEDLQTIQRSSDHLLSLINDVLDLSKIEAGHCTLEESGFDLISLLHTLRTMMAERAKAKHLQLTFEIAPEVPQFVIADEQKVRQVLLNLLSNAVKFTKQGSVTLQVTSWKSSENTCLVPSSSQNDGLLNQLIPGAACILQFAVADTGVGIAATEQETIFDAFMQAEAGRKSMSGTGLGLTISRRLLELMGGSISIESTPGVGSTFTVTVPVCPTSGVDGQAEQQERTIIGLAPGQRHHRILVVDDQRENRMLMVRLLTRLGLEAREATNGQEAIELWQQWHPDLTWMDIRMPDLDGYEATKQIRAMEHGQASIIIALTAQASQSDRALALAAGCNDYISKPFREETLFLKMKEYLGLEYIYAEAETSPGSPPISSPNPNAGHLPSFDPQMLAQVSADWLETLEDLALCGNDRAIVDIANQLAPEFEPFRMQLLDLANRFEFEQILHLIHPGSSP